MKTCETCRHYLGGGNCNLSMEMECKDGDFEGWEENVPKLKPCPFCGNKPEVRSVLFGQEPSRRYGVVCTNCAICIGWKFTEAEAVKRWNRRDGDGEAD